MLHGLVSLQEVNLDHVNLYCLDNTVQHVQNRLPWSGVRASYWNPVLADQLLLCHTFPGRS